MGNPHISNAQDWQHGDAEPSAFALQNALIESNLAIAFELRTANILAALQPVECAGGKTIHTKDEPAFTTILEAQKRIGVAADGSVEA